jgi:hypothetical protein
MRYYRRTVSVQVLCPCTMVNVVRSNVRLHLRPCATNTTCRIWCVRQFAHAFVNTHRICAPCRCNSANAHKVVTRRHASCTPAFAPTPFTARRRRVTTTCTSRCALVTVRVTCAVSILFRSHVCEQVSPNDCRMPKGGHQRNTHICLWWPVLFARRLHTRLCARMRCSRHDSRERVCISVRTMFTRTCRCRSNTVDTHLFWRVLSTTMSRHRCRRECTTTCVRQSRTDAQE